MRELILVSLLFLAGCGSSATDSPPEIRYGRDLCAECGMIIGEQRFAAALNGQDGEYQKFDDIGCMRMYQSKQGAAPKNFWVHDDAAEKWINGKDAVFTQTDNVITPMGYGVVASAGSAEAQKIVEQRKGQVLSWEEMLQSLKKKGGVNREKSL